VNPALLFLFGVPGFFLICGPVIDGLIVEVDGLPQSLWGGEYYFFGQNFERKGN
jgi:hypothetical protein